MPHAGFILHLFGGRARNNICAHIAGEGTAGDNGIVGAGSLGDRSGSARKGTAGDGQLAHVVGGGAGAAVDDGIGVGSERTAADAGLVPIHQRILGYILERAAGDVQHAAVIIFNGIQSAVEQAAGDGQCGGGGIHALLVFRAVVLIAVFHHAGILAALRDRYALADGHDAMIDKIVVGIPTIIFSTLAVLCAAGILAPIEDSGAVVEQGGFGVTDVVHLTVSGAVLQGQTAAQDDGNGMAPRCVGQGIAAQI